MPLVRQAAAVRSCRILGSLLVLLAAVAAPQPAVAQELADFLGAWEIAMQMQGGTTTMILTFAQAADGTLSGTWESPRGTAELQDVQFADGKITFTRRMGGGPQGEGQGGATASEATLRDGLLHLKMNTPRGERELTGKRKEG